MRMRYMMGSLLGLFFVISLLVSAPARLLNLALPGQPLLLQGLEGTLWRGSASRAVLRTEAGDLHLGALHWSLQPLSLLLFAPRLHLESAWGNQTLSGDVVLRGSQELDLHDFEASLAADLSRQFVPVSLGGGISVQLESLQLRGGLPSGGKGRVVWQNGSWQSPQGILPLGTYALDFEQPPAQILQGQVVTVSGPVSATGAVSLDGASYAIDVLVSGGGKLDPQLKQALSLIAALGPRGYQVIIEGELASSNTSSGE